MRRYVSFQTVAALVALSGCVDWGGGNDGLILRHLPMILTRGDVELERLYVVRDHACWERSIDEWDPSEYSPEVIEAISLRIEQSMDVDFNTEMVIFYIQPGCAVPMDIRGVYKAGNRLWVDIVEIRHPVVCMAAWSTEDVVVVPKSDAEVVMIKRPLYGYVFYAPLPPEIALATVIDGPCTQTSP